MSDNGVIFNDVYRNPVSWTPEYGRKRRNVGRKPEKPGLSEPLSPLTLSDWISGHAHTEENTPPPMTHREKWRGGGLKPLIFGRCESPTKRNET